MSVRERERGRESDCRGVVRGEEEFGLASITGSENIGTGSDAVEMEGEGEGEGECEGEGRRL